MPEMLRCTWLIAGASIQVAARGGSATFRGSPAGHSTSKQRDNLWDEGQKWLSRGQNLMKELNHQSAILNFITASEKFKELAKTLPVDKTKYCRNSGAESQICASYCPWGQVLFYQYSLLGMSNVKQTSGRAKTAIAINEMCLQLAPTYK